MFANWDYGWTVKVHHGDGYVSWYSHLASADPAMEGRWVNRGEAIGTSDTSGTQACHLHFDLRHNDRFTDPYGWSGSGADPLGSTYRNGQYGESSSYLWSDKGDSIVVVEDKSPSKFTGSVPTTDWARGNSWSMIHTANNPTMANYSGTWKPYLPTAPGFGTARYYAVFAYIPPEVASTTAARYSIGHAYGTSVVQVDQLANRNRWVQLGGYLFRGNSGLDLISLTNHTPADSGATRVAFDAIRFVQYRRYVPLVARSTPMSPLPGTWGTGLQIQNLSSSHVANVSLAFYWAVGTASAGQLAGTHTVTIPANGSASWHLPSG